MSQVPFDNIRACVFDAYGTLFDVHSAVARYHGRIGGAADQLSALWRSKQLEYTWLRSLMQRHTDFWHVTGDALDFALDTHGISDPGLRADLLQAYLELDCYEEVVGVLRLLKERGMRAAVLSNGSPRMLEAAVESAGLGELLDGVLSVEEVGIYKPHPSVYLLAVERLGVAREQVSFQSSNAWDIAGAASFGFRTAWINRSGLKRERLPFGADAELKTLNGLTTLLGLG